MDKGRFHNDGHGKHHGKPRAHGLFDVLGTLVIIVVILLCIFAGC